MDLDIPSQDPTIAPVVDEQGVFHALEVVDHVGVEGLLGAPEDKPLSGRNTRGGSAGLLLPDDDDDNGEGNHNPLSQTIATGAKGRAKKEDGPSHPVSSAADLERRKRRRQSWDEEQASKRLWDLQRRLIDISTDAELLHAEVDNVRSVLHIPLPTLAQLPDFERDTLDSAHLRRLTDIIYQHCRKTLNATTTHKWSWPFSAPVNIEVYKDYLQKIETPMDFGTIKKKLDGKVYTHPDQFLTDMRLVFDNAMHYNKPGSDVHVMAVTLKEKFEEKYSAAVQPRVDEENKTTEEEAMAARKRYASQAAAAAGPMREAAEARAQFLIKYIDQVTACIADAKSAAAALCTPVSRGEKEGLAVALGALPQDQFEKAIAVVMHHHPGLQPYDEIGFDLDMLDALTLRQLMSFVDAAAAAQGGSGGGGVAWPHIPIGSGLRPYPRASAPHGPNGMSNGLKIKKRNVIVGVGGASDAATAAPTTTAPTAPTADVPLLQPPTQNPQPRAESVAVGNDGNDTTRSDEKNDPPPVKPPSANTTTKATALTTVVEENRHGNGNRATPTGQLAAAEKEKMGLLADLPDDVVAQAGKHLTAEIRKGTAEMEEITDDLLTRKNVVAPATVTSVENAKESEVTDQEDVDVDIGGE